MDYEVGSGSRSVPTPSGGGVFYLPGLEDQLTSMCSLKLDKLH